MRRSTKVQLLAAAGMAISSYALSVESHLDDDSYEAMCDIGAGFSCTAVFSSEYAHPLSHWGLVPKGSELDLGLASAGLLLYAAYFLAACLWEVMPFRKHLFLAVASCSAAFSCYLLYVLKFILKDFCIVCATRAAPSARSRPTPAAASAPNLRTRTRRPRPPPPSHEKGPAPCALPAGRHRLPLCQLLDVRVSRPPKPQPSLCRSQTNPTHCDTTCRVFSAERRAQLLPRPVARRVALFEFFGREERSKSKRKRA